MKQREGHQIVNRYMDECVASFGFPIIERIEAALMVVASRDKRVIQQWVRKLPPTEDKRTGDQLITALAVEIRDHWKMVQEQKQRLAEEQTEAPEQLPEGNDLTTNEEDKGD